MSMYEALSASSTYRTFKACLVLLRKRTDPLSSAASTKAQARWQNVATAVQNVLLVSGLKALIDREGSRPLPGLAYPEALQCTTKRPQISTQRNWFRARRPSQSLRTKRQQGLQGTAWPPRSQGQGLMQNVGPRVITFIMSVMKATSMQGRRQELPCSVCSRGTMPVGT